MALKFVNGNNVTETHGLTPAPAVGGNGACTICQFPIQGQWYRSDRDQHKICSDCVDRYVRPISNNQLDVTPKNMEKILSKQNVDINMYNQMTHTLCSDLKGVACSMCNRTHKWAYVNRLGNNMVYACHITCVKYRIGANQCDETFKYETNPFWKAVGTVAVETFQEMVKSMAPPPFNSALGIILKLRAYKAHTRT